MFEGFFAAPWTFHTAVALWLVAVTDGIYLPDPKAPDSFRLCKLMVILDYPSRFCIGAWFYDRQQQFPLDDCFQYAVLRCGVPLNIYVDHDSISVSKHFRRMCAELRVHLIEASVDYPGRGKIERFVRMCKNTFYPGAQLLVRHGKLKTMEEVNEYLGAWVEQGYNQSLHGDEYPAHAYGR